MLNGAQAFRTGFLLRCAEEGLVGDALQARFTKAAEFVKDAGAVSDFIGAVVKKPLIATLGTGLAVGGLGGAALGAMSAPEDPGQIRRPPYLEDVQNAELAASYRQQADEIRRLVAQRARPGGQPARSPYGI